MTKNSIMDRTWLEKARRDKGLTQAKVAEAAGITTAFYNRVEKGLHTPNVVYGIRICDAVGCNVRQFLTEKPVK